MCAQSVEGVNQETASARSVRRTVRENARCLEQTRTVLNVEISVWLAGDATTGYVLRVALVLSVDLILSAKSSAGRVAPTIFAFMRAVQKLRRMCSQSKSIAKRMSSVKTKTSELIGLVQNAQQIGRAYKLEASVPRLGVALTMRTVVPKSIVTRAAKYASRAFLPATDVMMMLSVLEIQLAALTGSNIKVLSQNYLK